MTEKEYMIKTLMEIYSKEELAELTYHLLQDSKLEIEFE